MSTAPTNWQLNLEVASTHSEWVTGCRVHAEKMPDMGNEAAIRRLTISLFGPLRLRIGVSEAGLPTRRGARELFAALAFSAVPLERRWLAHALWPDTDEATARSNLRRHVAFLDSWIREQTGCAQPIVRGRTTLALNADLIESLDTRVFDDAVASDALEDAMHAYGGDLLKDLDAEWISEHRLRLRARYEDVVGMLVARARVNDASDSALRYLQHARVIDPYNESWLRMAMRVRYGTGDRAGALHDYQTYRTFLHNELELEPMPETFMLADSMRRLEALAEPAAPLEPTSFIGRADDSRELGELIARERLVTVTGEPGVGKSRLAVHTIRALSPDERERAIIVDVAAATGDNLERLLAQALERKAKNAWGASSEELAARLRAIIVFDGCERAMTACGTLVARLLAASDNVRVVTTSRMPIGVRGEVVFRLPPLPLPDAVALFIDRMQTARPRHRINDDDVALAERICRRLDGLPLAIELAAARTRVCSLQAIERELRDYSKAPGLGMLYASYESSLHLLTPIEERVFLRLAAFPSGWTSGTALLACSDVVPLQDCIATLTALVERSLVVPPAADAIDARYTMLATTRDFALARTAALGQRETNERAQALATAQHYIAIGASLRRERAVDYYLELERDRENCTAALQTLWRGDDGDKDLAVDLSLALSRFWADQGPAREGERWLQRALRHVNERPDKQIEVLRVIGTIARDLGDYQASHRHFSQLVEHLEPNSVEWGRAQTLAANAARMMGSFDEALARIEAAHSAFAESGEAYLAAWATYALGTTLLSVGRYADAGAELDRATQAFNDLDAVADSSSSIANLSLCHFHEGRLAVAHELARESLARAKATGHRYYFAHALLNEALILHALDRRHEAWADVLEASAAGAGLGSLDVIISVLETASLVLSRTRPEDAALLLGSADTGRERAHAPRLPVDVPLHDEAVGVLQTSLGSEHFAACRARGRVVSLNDALARLAALKPLFAVTLASKPREESVRYRS
jgi:predicted ATPase/DNA-binding SARP family transcriptional activator